MLKGTENMWYCKSGYPRDLVCEICAENIGQDAIRPDLWRCNFCRNCPVMNIHVPLLSVGNQSNTDASPILTCDQCEKYLCKYCAKHTKRLNQKSVIFDIMEDMQEKDNRSWAQDSATYQPSRFGSKLHTAFMAEVGEEMCQAELAHHANRSPESLLSRKIKDVFLYTRARAVDLRDRKPRGQDEAAAEDIDHDWDADGDDAWEWPEDGFAKQPNSGNPSRRQLSDVELYEDRMWYRFANDLWCSRKLLHERGSCSDGAACACPHAKEQVWDGDQKTIPSTPDAQMEKASVREFFMRVRFAGGKTPHLRWQDEDTPPVVVMSPAVKLQEGTSFAFSARWCLMQDHPWPIPAGRRHFMDMTDAEVIDAFYAWIATPPFPTHVVEEYMKLNGKSASKGLARKIKIKSPKTDLDDEQQPCDDEVEQDENEEDEEADEEEDEEEEAEEDERKQEEDEVACVYRAMRAGFLQELRSKDAMTSRVALEKPKHDCYRKQRVTDRAQEEQSFTSLGVMNVCEDSDDGDAYDGDEKEIQEEVNALRSVAAWVNLPTHDAAEDAFAIGSDGLRINLREPTIQGKHVDWKDVMKHLKEGNELKSADQNDFDVTAYPLDTLDPTQRVFADRLLAWGQELVQCYLQVEKDGVPRNPPVLRTWLAGSAGSGKSTTIKTVVYYLRHLFKVSGVPARIELTAYTGVAAFNIGFGARTTCSSFQVFPNATWNAELKGKAAANLEAQWASVELLVVDEISFIGRILLARMHYRMSQGRRPYFAKAAKAAADHQFGHVSMVLVGDFGQLEPIDDFSLCDQEAPGAKYSWLDKKHAYEGGELVKFFREAFVLKRIHRSGDDQEWTESCLRLRNMTADTHPAITQDYQRWLMHDLDKGHLDDEQKTYFVMKPSGSALCAKMLAVGMA